MGISAQSQRKEHPPRSARAHRNPKTLRLNPLGTLRLPTGTNQSVWFPEAPPSLRSPQKHPDGPRKAQNREEQRGQKHF